ncbi:hypothetical protein AB0N05_30815 [Nocardia sp. NPDC051030]|uniref:hypothetical protein n=1 Tax=Nocardia sp. NPDC051030 TaxID=3155162 RepID=UPI0034229CA8
MGEMGLSAERRSELAALLGDEARLRGEYPKVADYLDTAALLPGTGDQQGDAGFDLRLVNYLAGGASVTGNPYWDIVGPSVFVQEGRRVVNGGRATGSARLGYAQTVLQAVYAYAIPSPETVAWVAEFCVGKPVVEVGAGRGYWAAQLARAGITVDAFDVEPPDSVENLSFPRASGQRDVWHRVGGAKEYAARVAGGADYVLLLCWPPGWGSAMASEALAGFERAGGERVIFIGEPKGGKTGDDAFFDALAAGWELESEDARYVSWWNLADVAQGWRRR